jgi:transposase
MDSKKKDKSVKFFRWLITEIGYQRTGAMAREVATDLVIEEIVEKKSPLRDVAKKFDISVPTISTWIKGKIPQLKRGRHRIEGGRTFKKTSDGKKPQGSR